MAALEDKFPGAGREEERAFLLDHGDTLAAVAGREGMGDDAVEKDAAG